MKILQVNKFLKELKQYIKNEAYEYRQDVIANILKSLALPKTAKFLDIGCAEGAASLRYANIIKIEKENIYGLDINEDCLKTAAKKFKVLKVDLETDIFPFEDNYFNLIIIDQVFEHIKNIEHLVKEISRVLKPNGYFIVSVPNLGALHNRFLLLFGRQPFCLNIFNDHIRGFTKKALKEFILNNIKGCQVISFKGAGFYPFFGNFAKILYKIFPNLSVYMIFIFKNENSSS